MDLGPVIKGLAPAFFSFIVPKIKNVKALRDFKDKWVRDNHSEKIVLMFQASVDDAKSVLELPNEVVNALLDDEKNRKEIFRWIIEGVSYDELDPENFFLEPYYEQYPQHQDKLIPFFHLILLSINDYKEKNWDPEFLNIIQGIERIREDIRTGFDRLEMKTETNFNQFEENLQSTLLNALGPVGYDDLKELLVQEKVITARKKAEERIKHARSNEEKLELNAVIANSYMISNQGKLAIPYLYTAISFCQDDSRKNRLHALINIFEEKLDEALIFVNKNIDLDGYTQHNMDLLLNIYSLQNNYESCLLLLDKYEAEVGKELKARILLSLNEYDSVFILVDEGLDKNPNSKEWMLIKAEANVLRLEYLISKGIPVDYEETFKLIKPLLNTIEEMNENERQLIRIKELNAALYFRTKRFKEAAINYEDIFKINSEKNNETGFMNLVLSYYFCQDWEKAISLLEDKIKENRQVEKITLLSKIYIDSGNPQKALIILEEFENMKESCQDNPLDFYFVKLEVLFRLFKHKEIASFLKEVEDTYKIELIYVIKGYYAVLQGDWDTAIINFELAVDLWEGQNLIELKILLVDSYRKRGEITDYQRLIELLPTLPHWMDNEFLINTYILSLHRFGRYEEVLFFYYNELKNFTVLIQDLVAHIHYQSDWYELAKDMYEKLFYQTDDIKFLCRYSNCLFRLGDVEGCLNTLQVAEKRVRENASIDDLDLLTIAYLEAMEYEKALEYAYQTFKYDERNPDLWRAFFWRYIQITQIIESPIKEYEDAFQKITSDFHGTFPQEEELFEQVQAIETNGEISKDLISKMKSLQTSQIEIEELVINNKLPLQTFYILTKKEPYLIWGHVANHERIMFWANQTGSQEDILKGIQSVVSSRKVLCDLFSILTLDYLGLLEQFAEEFTVYVYQEQFNSLFFEFSQLKLSRHKGVKSISYDNERILAQEWTSEQVEDSLAKMDTLIDWLNKNSKKVGKPFINPSSQKETLLFDEQLQLCKDSLFSMMIDSFFIKDHASNDYGVDTFSVIDFVNYLLSKKVLDKVIYNHVVGKLIMIGYRYVTADAEVFTQYLNENEFNLTGEIKWLFKYLGEEGVNREYVFIIVLEILDVLSKEKVLHQEELMEFLCDLLVGETKKKDWLVKLLLTCQKVYSWEEKYFGLLKDVIERKIS